MVERSMYWSTSNSWKNVACGLFAQAMNKKTLFRWIKVLVFVYCVVGIAIYYGQERLIFHPVKAERNTWYRFEQPSTELNLNYDSGVSLNIVEFRATDRPADSTARGVVLFFHGNT